MIVSPLLQTAIDAVKEASKIILHYYKQGVETKTKTDRTLVTKADQEAEETIKRMIAKKFPDHGFFGEESGKTNTRKEFVWIIDPIDGTNHFIRKFPFFATQLALYRNTQPLIGVSYAPLLDELLVAEIGRGASFNGAQTHVSRVFSLSDAFLNITSVAAFEREHRLPQLVRLCESVRQQRGYGDFYGYHLVARGQADLMIEAQTKPWDIAAMRVIIEEAGGRFTNISGGTEFKGDVLNSIASNGLIHDEVLTYFQRG